MDSFFGIGLPELILILLLAGLVMGPQRIRVVARKLGVITAQLQNISRQFARQLNAELDALEGDDVKGAWDEVRQLQKEVRSLRQELGNASRSMIGEGKAVVDEVERPLNPPQDESLLAPDNDQPLSPDVEINLPKALDVPDDPD